MKQNSILINTSRGGIINEDDLIKALKQKRITGAGLDVFSTEPYQGKLLEFDNVVATPHIAGYTKEIRSKMELEAAKNLVKGLELK
jgi:D-3-phosphoglycerate dehydrogenase